MGLEAREYGSGMHSLSTLISELLGERMRHKDGMEWSETEFIEHVDNQALALLKANRLIFVQYVY